jgi:hypothetical protein
VQLGRACGLVAECAACIAFMLGEVLCPGDGRGPGGAALCAAGSALHRGTSGWCEMQQGLHSMLPAVVPYGCDAGLGTCLQCNGVAHPVRHLAGSGAVWGAVWHRHEAGRIMASRQGGSPLVWRQSGPRQLMLMPSAREPFIKLGPCAVQLADQASDRATGCI